MEQPLGFLTILLKSAFNTPVPVNVTSLHTMRPFHEWPTVRPFHERHTLRPPLGPHWDSKHIQTEPPSNAVAARESGLAFSFEKLLWVFLGGFGVMVLLAILMKLGGPIRRVHHDDSNLDMASLLRLSDDLPPPYSECLRSSTNKHEIEEPPPRFSECFVSFTNPKDAEPKVHIRRQYDLIKNRLKVESVPMNNSECVAPGMRTQLVDDGRTVERLS